MPPDRSLTREKANSVKWTKRSHLCHALCMCCRQQSAKPSIVSKMQNPHCFKQFKCTFLLWLLCHVVIVTSTSEVTTVWCHRNSLLCSCPGGIKRWSCLTSVSLSDVCRIHAVGSRPAGWHILADRARLSQPGSRLPLCASVAGLGGVYCDGCLPTACYLFIT